MGHLAIKKLQEIVVSPVGKVIKAEDYQCIAEGKQAIAEINEQAQALYRQTREEAREAGELEAQKILDEQIMNSIVTTVEYLSRVEGKMVSVTMEAVKKIIGSLDEDTAVRGLVKKALYKVRNQGQVTLRVTPARAPEITRRIKEITADYPNIDFVDVVPDMAIGDGACRLETEAGSIDTSIDLQIELLEKALVKTFQGEQ